MTKLCKPILPVLAIYIFIQNFLKWIPFPANHTAQALPTVQDNLVSIISSLSLFCIVIILLFPDVIREFKIKKVDFAVAGFGAFLLVQTPFREAKTEELVRSLALIASLASSVFLAKYFSASQKRLEWLFRTMKWSLFLSVVCGLFVAIIRPESTDWGGFSGAQCLGQMLCRTEFFFFAVNPVFNAVLFWQSRPRMPIQRALFIFGGLALFSLMLMTRTRQLTLTTLTAALMIFLLWIKDKKRFFYIFAAFTVVAAVLAGPALLKFFLEYTRIVPEQSAIAVDARAADWTSGRLQLLSLVTEMFKSAPVFGLGGVKVRELIHAANLNARTEHGFSFYLAAYGLFGLILIGYLFYAFLRGVRILWDAFRNRLAANSPQVTLALIAVPLIPFGFVGLFGSSTNPTDWFSLVFAGLICQISLKPIPERIAEIS